MPIDGKKGRRKDYEKMNNELIYEIDGNMGKTLLVYADRCIISAKGGVKGALFGSLLDGDKEFYYRDITSVQFKNLSMSSGFLQFEYPGSRSVNNFVSENSFVFSATIGTAKYKALKAKMPDIYEDIRKRVNDAKAETKMPVSALSGADELKKYKDLLDMGVITQEEFDQKKKQLLGL